METIHVTFDELTGQTAPVHSSSGPAPNLLTPGPISSGLVPTSDPAIPYVAPTNKELELLFQMMFDEYFETTTGDPQMPPVPLAQAPAIPTGPSVSISFDRDAPSGSHSPSSSTHQSSSVHHGVATEHSFEVNPFAATEHELFVNTDSHPLDNIIRNPSRPVSTQKQLATDALWCFYNSVLSKVEPKNFKSAVTEDCWFQAMQHEIHEIDRLDVKTDEYGDVCKTSTSGMKRISSRKKVLTLKNPRLVGQLEAIRIFSCQGDQQNMTFIKIDVKTAFLMATKEESSPVDNSHGGVTQNWNRTSRIPVDQTHTQYQSKPTKKHLEAVKRVFQYLQGTINMGLWYPKDTAMAPNSKKNQDADQQVVKHTKKQHQVSAQFLWWKV
ncbi:hypothetical protein Tco_0728440 [Tanacetum coccineum]|uniref:Reverse transcriptase Ty1/copia-type domain-containing protein n=1 Tax=Tanacetum coccineum TaxID=301880 RepID=A0ABQ4YL55_9ASTR